MADGEPPEEGVCLDEVLQLNSALEAEAIAVLGGSDPKNCTYSKGVISRQAVFTCATCIPVRMPGVKPAGFCLACSLVCHNGHEIFELYTKRDFRCDCGNARFDGARCRLFPDKAPENSENIYSHNFLGNYCTCDRPYPDPDAKDQGTADDDMLQCIVCEDWFHEQHLGQSAPEEYEEMVCDSCVTRCPFMFYYSLAGPGREVKPKPEPPVSDLEAPSDSSCTDPGQPATSPAEEPTEDSGIKTEPAASVDTSYESLEVGCDLESRKTRCEASPNGKAAYFEEGWRTELCTCAKCLVHYEELNVTFLPDITDSISAYEQRGQANSPSGRSTCSLEEQGLHALSGLPVEQQVEMNTEYTNMRDELTAFLRPFAAEGKVVSDTDIRRFFDQLNDRKRRPPSDSFPPGANGRQL